MKKGAVDFNESLRQCAIDYYQIGYQCAVKDASVVVADSLQNSLRDSLQSILTKSIESNTTTWKSLQEILKINEIPIELLNLSVRSYNYLARAGIKTVGDIAKHNKETLLCIRNLGRRCAEEVLIFMETLGYTLDEK